MLIHTFESEVLYSGLPRSRIPRKWDVKTVYGSPYALLVSYDYDCEEHRISPAIDAVLAHVSQNFRDNLRGHICPGELKKDFAALLDINRDQEPNPPAVTVDFIKLSDYDFIY